MNQGAYKVFSVSKNGTRIFFMLKFFAFYVSSDSTRDTKSNNSVNFQMPMLMFLTIKKKNPLAKLKFQILTSQRRDVRNARKGSRYY